MLPGEMKYFKRRLRDAAILRIASKVADYYQLNIEDLAKQTRKKEIVEARSVAIFFHSFRSQMSFRAIGLIYNLTSCSVTYSRNKVEEWGALYSDFRKKLNTIANSIVTKN